jgi:hypothetical protein
MGTRIIEETRGTTSNSTAPLRNQQIEVSTVIQSVESIDIEVASGSSLPLSDD